MKYLVFGKYGMFECFNWTILHIHLATCMIQRDLKVLVYPTVIQLYFLLLAFTRCKMVKYWYSNSELIRFMIKFRANTRYLYP